MTDGPGSVVLSCRCLLESVCGGSAGQRVAGAAKSSWQRLLVTCAGDVEQQEERQLLLQRNRTC